MDAVGGITVNNILGFPISISDQEEFNTISIGVGEQHIGGGEEALVYARMRYQDPEGGIMVVKNVNVKLFKKSWKKLSV